MRKTGTCRRNMVPEHSTTVELYTGSLASDFRSEMERSDRGKMSPILSGPKRTRFNRSNRARTSLCFGHWTSLQRHIPKGVDSGTDQRAIGRIGLAQPQHRKARSVCSRFDRPEARRQCTPLSTGVAAGRSPPNRPAATPVDSKATPPYSHHTHTHHFPPSRCPATC